MSAEESRPNERSLGCNGSVTTTGAAGEEKCERDPAHHNVGSRAAKMQITEQRAKQGKRGNPSWRPGVSGNPRGRASRRERHAKLMHELAAELGGLDALTVAERVTLSMAVDLMMRKVGSAEDHVRICNTVDRMLRSLRRTHAVKREAGPHVPLRDRIGGVA
jgi:hypothetical protein